MMLNDQEPKLSEPASIEAIEVHSSPEDAKRAVRRRLLVSGAKIAPVVVATLASRSALACHCAMPSAWGSINAAEGKQWDMANQVNLTGSYSRLNKDWLAYNPYTIAQWAAGGSTACWTALINKFKGYPNATFSTANKYKYLQGTWNGNKATVATLWAAMGFTLPNGIDGSKGLLDRIQYGDNFVKSILVAQLNLYLGLIPTQSQVGDTSCLRSDGKSTLNAMASGTYYPLGASNMNVKWGKTQIQQYLYNNWMAR